MNTLHDLKSNRASIMALAHRFKAVNPRVFGSVASQTDGDKSDIDILVDPAPGATLFDLGALQQELQQLLGRPVDLLTPNDLPIKFRQSVLDTAVEI